MRKLYLHPSLALAATLLVAQPAAAETFRCGQWIASKDMSVAELLEKCGEPTTKSVRYEDNLREERRRGHQSYRHVDDRDLDL